MAKIRIQNRIGYQIDTLSNRTASSPHRSNAPVTRASWSCDNLPEGVTLSSSGLLEGHPTVAGVYSCDVELSTNWGTTEKTITITVR